MKQYAIAAALLAAGTCASAQPPKPTVALLVDVSASVPDPDRSATYRKSFESAAAAASVPGARLVVGTIGSASKSGWVPLFDGTMPAKSGFELEDAKAAADFAKSAGAAFDKAMESARRNPDMGSCVTDSIEAVSEAFVPSGRKNFLVLLSDMVEDGRHCLRGERRPPASLLGAEVRVAGAGGNADYDRVEGRWRRYFEKAGATLAQYGRFPASLEKGGRK